MKFRLIFTKINGWVLHQESTPIGLNELDEARAELNCNFDSSLMYDTVTPYNVVNLEMFISEEDARKTGLFANRWTETITVKTNLNKFVKRVLFVNRDDQNDAIKSLGFKNVVDNKEIFEAWLQAGCPIEWEV